MAGAADVRVGKLSRGQQQRVSLARAIVHAPTVLLLLCGLNDFKRAHRGATSSAFHAELSALVAEVRDICGPHTLVVLPALPLAATARFPVPLHWLVCALGARYDEQKRRLAQRLSFAPQGPARAGAVLFVDAPALPPYVVFVDAGSTGSRVHVFQVSPRAPPAFHVQARARLRRPLRAPAHPQSNGTHCRLQAAAEKFASPVPLASLAGQSAADVWCGL
jgi:hypothetical protein